MQWDGRTNWAVLFNEIIMSRQDCQVEQDFIGVFYL